MAVENTSKEEQLFAALLYADNPKDVLAEIDSATIISLLENLQKNSSALGIDQLQKFQKPFASLTQHELIYSACEILDLFSVALELENIALSHVDSIQRLETKENDLGDILPTSINSKWRDSVRNYADGTESLLLPKKKSHWLSPDNFFLRIGKNSSKENKGKVRAFIQLLCINTEREFNIDGKKYKSYDLFGFFQNYSNFTWYINPIALPWLIEELGWCPKLPDDGVTRISASDMTNRVFRTTKFARLNLVKSIANELLQNPDQEIAPDHTQPKEKKSVHTLMGYYNAKGKRSEKKGILFFTEEMEAYIKHRVSLAPYRPTNKEHFISENDILKNSGFFGYAKMRPFYREALRELIEELKLKTDTQERIGFYRHEGAESYHVDPMLRQEYLTDKKIIERAQTIKVKKWTRESGEPQPKPDDKKHWIPASLVSRKLGFTTPEARQATESVMQQQYNEDSVHIGYFVARGKNGVYGADPASVGSAITKEMVIAQLNRTKQLI